MKKIIISLILLISFLLVSCAETQTEEGSGVVTEIGSESVSESSKVITDASSEVITDSSEVIDESSEVSDESSEVIDESALSEPTPENPNPAPEKNISASPLLFLDTTDYFGNKAYIISAFNEDGICSIYDFRYSDKNLLDYLESQGVAVETNIIDTSEKLTFYDKNGKSFETSCGNISCYGEMIIEEVHVLADLNGDLPKDGKRFLGTYSGIDIFPDKIEYGENQLSVDLDSDGNNELIKWSFSLAEGDWGEADYYYYTLEAVIGGKSVPVSDNYLWVPIEKNDFEIFIADIDMDGIFEVFEYIKAASRFNNVFIYKINHDHSEMIHFYTITPEP